MKVKMEDIHNFQEMVNKTEHFWKSYDYQWIKYLHFLFKKRGIMSLESVCEQKSSQEKGEDEMDFLKKVNFQLRPHVDHVLQGVSAAQSQWVEGNS